MESHGSGGAPVAVTSSLCATSRQALAGCALLVLAACSREDWSDPAKVAAATADVQIIEAVVDHRMQRWHRADGQASRVLVMKTIGGSPPPESFSREQAASTGWGRTETWDSFFTAQKRRLSLPPGLRPHFELVAESAMDAGFGGEMQWHDVRVGYPGSDGYFAYDALVVSNDGTEAIVMWSWICGTLCGDGSISRLVFEDGKWRVADTQRLWVS